MKKCVLMLCLFTGIIFQLFAGVDRNKEPLTPLSDVKGGLVVCIDCSDPSYLLSLRKNNSYLIHGLYSNKEQAAKARSYINDKNLYGKITVGRWDGKNLPYVDNLVNQIVVANDKRQVPREEIERVLAPGGIYIENAKVKFTKPIPEDTDSWTHYLYDSSNNAVSRDKKVAPPRGMHWVCGPRYARSHEHFASVSAMVSDNGRVFYIEDVGPISSVFLKPSWRLVARDAYSGVLLWKRRIENWESQLRGFRSGPPEIGWRLVVSGERVYVALNYGEPITAFDAATGKKEHIFKDTEGAREFRCRDGVLYVLADDLTAEDHKKRKKWFNDLAPTISKYTYPKEKLLMYGKQRIIAIDLESKKTLWEQKYMESGEIMPTTLAVDEGRVCFQTVSHVVCLDAKSGTEEWRSKRPVAVSRFSWSTPTIVINDGVVISGDRMPNDNIGAKPEEGSTWIMDNHHQKSHQNGEVFAFSLKDGKELWNAPAFENYTIPMDIFVINGVVWIGDIRSKKYPGFTKGRDLHTGKIVKEVPDNNDLYDMQMGHNRCYRNKATERFLLLGRDGIEFLDLRNKKGFSGWWVRGTCQYGIMPANGLVYVPKHSCACHAEELLKGFNVLSSKSGADGSYKTKTEQLEKGSAYAESKKQKTKNKNEHDWPMYRKDTRRSGFQDMLAPKKTKIAWTEEFNAPVTAPVCADKKIFIAEKDRQVLHAVSEDNGKKIWSFPADGRIDSPPSVCNGLCVFGTRNGYVYCVSADNGKLAWRFRAAPRDRMIFSYGQLESIWPVYGSVLIDDELSHGKPVVYFSAGRSSHLDGGIQLYALDLNTGKVLHNRRIVTMRDESGDDIINARALPGIMSVQKKKLFMRHLCFNKKLKSDKTVPHLYAPRGFLDNTWWHRTYWVYGTQMRSAWGGWPRTGNRVPAGRLLVYDGGELIYGYGRMSYQAGKGHVQPGAEKEYKLFAEIRSPKQEKDTEKNKKRRNKNRQKRQIKWSVNLPFVARSMVLTQDALLVAGGESLTESADRHKPGTFMIASREDSNKQFECDLPAPPILDGMAFTDSGVFISAIDGSLICLKDE